MKKYLLLIASVLLLAACSSPKYAYYFDHYDYNSGKKKVATNTPELSQINLSSPELSPLQLDNQAISASAESRLKNVENVPVLTTTQKNLLAEKYSSLSKEEKKEFRKEIKTVVKKAIKAKKSGKSIESIAEVQAMDHDLKMALIFTIVAIVLGAFYGTNTVFGILSLISIVVAIVFFIQWLARQ
jgi:uncharacterized membrane protein